MPVGCKMCQSGLSLLVLTCHCLRETEVNQIYFRGLLLRALSLNSWQQWAHWWITVLYVKHGVYVFKVACMKEWRTKCDWESAPHKWECLLGEDLFENNSKQCSHSFLYVPSFITLCDPLKQECHFFVFPYLLKTLQLMAYEC